MHSRIIELSDKPVAENERYSVEDVPDWFLCSIADYVGEIEESERDCEIGWIAEWFGGLCTRDGDKLTIVPDAREKFFRPMYSRFLEAAANLMTISYKSYCGEVDGYRMWRAMFELNNAYEDKFGGYVYDPKLCELQTMHEWLRNADLSKPYYVGGIIDYHW